MRNADAREDVGNKRTAGAVHRINGVLHARLGNQVEIGKVLDGLQVGGQKIYFGNGCGLVGAGNRLVQVRLNLRDNRRLARASVPRLVLHAVPLRRIMR